MRAIDFMLMLAILAICGCAGHRTSSHSETVAASKSAPITEPSTNSAATMVGTWRCREGAILLELDPHEHWKWWDLSEQSGSRSERPMLAGGWFVRDGILYLRIEQTKDEPERIGPGLAFALEVKAVNRDSLVLHHPREEEDKKFERIADE